MAWRESSNKKRKANQFNRSRASLIDKGNITNRDAKQGIKNDTFCRALIHRVAISSSFATRNRSQTTRRKQNSSRFCFLNHFQNESDTSDVTTLSLHSCTKFTKFHFSNFTSTGVVNIYRPVQWIRCRSHPMTEWEKWSF